MLSAYGQTALWTVIFFFASAAASSAYLTASEVFPLELRALAIAVFYALGTAAGGVAAPWLFGALIGTGERVAVFWGYVLGARADARRGGGGMAARRGRRARFARKRRRTPCRCTRRRA